MGYDVTLLPNEPILLAKFDEDFSVARDGEEMMGEMKRILDASSTPLYMLDDFLKLKMSFPDLVAALAMSTRGSTAVMRHPNVRKLVIVSTSELLRLGGNALKQAQYGGFQADIYPSLDEALTGIRKEMASLPSQT
jgi:hypothetical protein